MKPLPTIYYFRKQENFYLYEDNSADLPEKIFGDDNYKSSTTVKSTSNVPMLVYNLKGGQLSNSFPITILYKFVPGMLIISFKRNKTFTIINISTNHEMVRYNVIYRSMS